MYASRLVNVLNTYERNFHNAYITWYDNDLDNFLEPDYNPLSIVEDVPELDWHKSEKTCPDYLVMTDGSVLAIDSMGVWRSYKSMARVATKELNEDL